MYMYSTTGTLSRTVRQGVSPVSQACVFPRRENGRQPILASVCDGAAPPPCSVRQSRTPAARGRIHDGAMINIDARKCGRRPHLRASYYIFLLAQ